MRARLPDLETLGLRYFRRRAALLRAPNTIDPVHILDAEEQRALKRIERGAIARAALAGALSAGAAATTEVMLYDAGLHGTTTGTAILVGVTLAATAAELAFLYWDGLRSVHELARAAGISLFAEKAGESLASALARAALELPNRPDPGLGVNPYRNASRVMLVAAALLYKAKIGLTNFLVRALLRRLGGRAAMRGWLPFVAVPITAIWNALVAWTVMREARIRAMGPSAAAARLEDLFAGRAPLSAAARLAALRAIGYTVVAKRDLHPNLAALLLLLRERLGEPGERLDDQAAFLAALPELEPGERARVLDLLVLAAIIDGRLTRRERRLLVDAHEACGLPADLAAVRRLRRAFVAGRSLGAVP